MDIRLEQLILSIFIGSVSFLGGILYTKFRQRKRILHLIETNRALVENVNSLKDLYKKEDQKNEEEQFSSADMAMEAERKRIANELHDDTVQRMVAVRLRLEQILYYPIHDGATKEVKGLRKELDDIVAALRFLINDLTQPRFEQRSLSHLIGELATTLGAMHHVKVSMKSTNPEQEFYIPPKIKQELYYMVHETAHNFLKNSMGFTLTIHLNWSEYLTIILKDNGQGLGRGRGYGRGMVSMHERANRIQAQLLINSLNDGLQVFIQVKNTYS